MARMNIPDEYKEEVEKLLKKLQREKELKDIMRMLAERNSFARDSMYRDPEYRAALKELEKPFLDKYKQLYMQMQE